MGRLDGRQGWLSDSFISAVYLITRSLLKSSSELYRPGNLPLCGSAASYTDCQAAGSAATASAMPAKAGKLDRCSSCRQELSGSQAEAGLGRGLIEPVITASACVWVGGWGRCW